MTDEREFDAEEEKEEESEESDVEGHYIWMKHDSEPPEDERGVLNK